MKLLADVAYKAICKCIIDIPKFSANNCYIALSGTNDCIEISIETLRLPPKAKELLWETFQIVFELLFLALGAFPKINSFIVDESPMDITNIANKYTTAKAYIRQSSYFMKIDCGLINVNNVRKMISINRKPLLSLEYIVSESYSTVMTVHKTLLLLNAAQGIYHSIEQKDCKQYCCVIKAVFIEFFRIHDSMEESEQILSQLKKTKEEFFNVLVDTRDDITHFLEVVDKDRTKGKKVDSLDRKIENGTTAMWEYSYCIILAIRLYLIEFIRGETDKANIKEEMLIIRDWIYKHNCKQQGKTINPDAYKSRMYKIRASYQKFLESFKRI